MKNELNLKKIFKPISNDKFEIIDELQNNREQFIEALHIMKATIDNYVDQDSLIINVNRMNNYLKKYEI